MFFCFAFGGRTGSFFALCNSEDAGASIQIQGNEYEEGTEEFGVDVEKVKARRSFSTRLPPPAFLPPPTHSPLLVRSLLPPRRISLVPHHTESGTTDATILVRQVRLLLNNKELD